jgi:formamidopyrimidine-DNA glycosylase
VTPCRVMPELPEVEATRRALENEITGRTVVDVSTGHPRTLRRQDRPSDFADRLRGRRVEKLGRHGKFLQIEMTGDLTWVTHLGMSGRIQLAEPGQDRELHTRAVIAFDRGREVRFVDPRTFGFMVVWTFD